MDRDTDLVNDILADLANFRLSVSSSQPRHRHGQQYGAGAGAPGADLSPFTSILPSIISHTHGRERRSVLHALWAFIDSFYKRLVIHIRFGPTDICLYRVQCIISERSAR